MTRDVTPVYRLVVELPPGADEPGWEPENLAQLANWHPWDEREHSPFHWPRRRHFFCPKRAREAAAVLRSYGATVSIEKGEVAWP